MHKDLEFVVTSRTIKGLKCAMLLATKKFIATRWSKEMENWSMAKPRNGDEFFMGSLILLST